MTKIIDVTNDFAIDMIETSSSIGKKSIYKGVEYVRSHIGLSLQRSYFYGRIIDGVVSPLDLINTLFNTSDEVILLIEGPVPLSVVPVNIGSGSLTIRGFGLIHNDGDILFDNRASGGGGGDLALGETSITAYRGDRGKAAYDHSQLPHAPSNATVNDTDVNLKDRGNHTGTQPAVTISDFNTAVDSRLVGKQNTSEKDASDGYVGLTSANINFKSSTTSVVSFFTNSNITPKIYAFQDRNGTIADTVDLAAKEDQIALGSTSQYWRGDKSWQSLNKSAVGLPNVDNTSDAGKPVSTLQAEAIDLKQTLSEKDSSDGYVGLTLFKINFKNALNTVASYFTNNNTVSRTYTFQDRDATIADDIDLATKENTITAGTTLQYYRGDKTFQTLDKTTVGLSNVNNTSDANKPISIATQAALDTKVDLADSGIKRIVNVINVDTPALAAAKTDYIYIATAVVQLTIPTAVGNTNRYTFKNAFTSNCTVIFTGGQNADGSTSLTIVPNQSIDLISNNTNYNII